MNTTIESKAMLTKEETAVFLQISTPTLERWIKAGKITPIRIGRTVRFDKEDLLKQISAQTTASV